MLPVSGPTPVISLRRIGLASQRQCSNWLTPAQILIINIPACRPPPPQQLASTARLNSSFCRSSSAASSSS